MGFRQKEVGVYFFPVFRGLFPSFEQNFQIEDYSYGWSEAGELILETEFETLVFRWEKCGLHDLLEIVLVVLVVMKMKMMMIFIRYRW